MVALVVGILDVLAPLVFFFVGKYAPAYLEDSKVIMAAVVGCVTLIGAALIGGIAYEDGQEKANGTHATQVKRSVEAMDLYSVSRVSWPGAESDE